MSRILLVFFSLISYSCSNNKLYEQKISNLNKTIDSLNQEIVTNEETINILRDEIQFREGEISYWGHKLDSCMGVYEKK